MFDFGFGGILVITQLYGLGFKHRQRWLVLAVYLGSTFWVYSGRGWIKLHEIIRIPLIE